MEMIGGLNKSSLTISLCLLFATTFTITIIAADDSKFQREIYIVYMGEVPEKMISHAEHHHNIPMTAIPDEAIARESRIHSYGRSIYGFVAKLLPHEVARLREHSEVVSVFRSEKKKLVTTRSWNFLGFTEKRAIRNLKLESNTIVGLLDSGIDIRAPSFNDEGYGEVPSKWKGKCDIGPDFPGCNKKVIGATWYNVGQIDESMTPTPYAYIGHGSHTSSTAAGTTVRGASLYGLGLGTARGGVPNARIAMYRVCGLDRCSDANILAGYDDAIADGVDILSVSLGSFPTSFYRDSNAIGAFHAMRKGIPVVLAGGNEGPRTRSVSNVAPWMFTVGATNMDREFVTKVRLGNGVQVSGISLNAFMPPKKMLPLIAGSSAQNSSQASSNASTCDPDGMIKEKVKGCIVLCYDFEDADTSLHQMGVAGALMVSETNMDTGFADSIPASQIDYTTANRVANYIKSTKNPTATIFKSIGAKVKAPTIASYSSRGPQAVLTNILKPDISAPGTDILAAYSKAPSVTGLPDDNRHGYFNIISGTSMATPHTAGVIAYVKSFHPDWSPAALKSAVMTTATPVQVRGPEQPLESGSGQIVPLRAVHPGLVYDIKPSDYIRYLCREGYNSSTLQPIVGGKKLFNCSNYPAPRGHDGINYPSMHLQLPIDQPSATVMFHREVTYVGDGPSVFEARVNVLAAGAKELSVNVTPETLSFNHTHQKKSFRVEVKAEYAEESHGTLVAFLEWADSRHSVRSPIVVFRPSIDD